MVEQSQQPARRRQPPSPAVMVDYAAIAIMLLGSGLILSAAFAVDIRLGLAAIGVIAFVVGYLLATRDGVAGG